MKLKRILIIVCIIYVFAGAAIVYFTNTTKVKNLIEFYKSNQNELLDYVKAGFEDLPDEDIENPEKISKIFNFEHTYGFVYKENIVVYERDIETTMKYKNSTARELFNDYAQASGGSNTVDIRRILFKDSGTAYVQKINSIGEEIISWRNVRKNDNDYVIGIGIPLNTVLEISNYKRYMMTDILLYLINCVMVIGLSLALWRKVKAAVV